ncbi:hypothetical protein O6H91_19G043700 [Diphasiastrum complanatum]|uniref:Uncharacterized protein n=1 Tax=Diphasiastrum complanatum TaxID=34168 RepID=A0ACC2AUN5_DIPCM|nr:hypothetical protein O6H91_19G043700 [Diphasiastrum complanatum]
MEADASGIPMPIVPRDERMWSTFQGSFSRVQNLLDHNRLLISEINRNHETKLPESLTRNVTLIRELNNNISKVVELYSNLTAAFVHDVAQPAGEDSARPDLITNPSQSQKRVRSD